MSHVVVESINCACTRHEPPRIKEFREWFVCHGGSINDSIYFDADSSGMAVYARTDLPPHTHIISCPFDLVITDKIARNTLCAALEVDGHTLRGLSERQVIASYVSLYLVEPSSGIIDISQHIQHRPYISILPPPSSLLTPLFFNPTELALFEGTNLHAATLSQEQTWQAEWAQIQNILSHSLARPSVVEGLKWEYYLAAATYLTSRAFPSTLISETPSLIATQSSYPVLIPGVDSLNHKRAQPVTWSVEKIYRNSDGTSTATDIAVLDELSISLILDNSQPAGTELFNNYGPKPNSSLILAYGFATPDNPDDTILLSIGGGTGVAEGTGRSNAVHEIGRDAGGAEGLWEDVRQRLELADVAVDEEKQPEDGGDDDDETSRSIRSLELDMRAADALSGMVQQRLARLPHLPITTADEVNDKTDNTSIPAVVPSDVRPAVYSMWTHYVRGQIEILEQLGAWAESKEREAVARAQELGVEFEEAEEGDEEDLND